MCWKTLFFIILLWYPLLLAVQAASLIWNMFWTSLVISLIGKCVSGRVNQTVSYWKMFSACGVLISCVRNENNSHQKTETTLDWFTWVMRFLTTELQCCCTEVSLPQTWKCSSRWSCTVRWLCVTSSGRDPAWVFRETVLVFLWSFWSLHEIEVLVLESGKE